MLDHKIKQKFDSARQILVGKIPSPTAQIEQITFAMIVKFIDDMKVYKLPYKWSDFSTLENDSSTLVENYQATLTHLSESKDLPTFFSMIFKNAKLNFESGEILRKFLSKINEFDYYKDSEILGEGYEYLLQQYGKQGALGQFRTPKHIIDFIVEVVEPSKKDKIHDPACGTGGFLVSALNYVYSHNTGNKPGDKIRPDEKNHFLKNLLGFDVSPDMTRLALVNLWLQGVGDPSIQEYDTISNPSRWNDYYDIILTNPPFMTPKEGMVVHSKFKNKSKRCPDLFLDYLLQHLKPNGRAGIVVPDGTVSVENRLQLREDCLKNGLYAVCELHGYTFKPYATVKTHIMFFDKSLNNQKVIFIDIENDGFKLSSQRKEHDQNDLPEASKVIKKFKKGQKIEKNTKLKHKIIDFSNEQDPFLSFYLNNKIMVTKPFILENRDNDNKKRNFLKMEDLFNFEEGSIASTDADGGEYIFFTADETLHSHSEFTNDNEAIILTYNAGGSLGRIHYADGNSKYSISNLNLLLTKNKNFKGYLNLFFYSNYLKAIKERLVEATSAGVGKRTLNKKRLKNFFISIFEEKVQKQGAKKLNPSVKKILNKEREIAEEKIRIIKFFKNLN